MLRSSNTVRWMAIATLFVAVAALAVPVCAMPECDAAPVSAACSDAAPACADCGSGQAVVMRHTPDQGPAPTAFSPDRPVAVSSVLTAPEPALVAFTVAEPAPTGAPPPLDPLGVRLIV